MRSLHTCACGIDFISIEPLLCNSTPWSLKNSNKKFERTGKHFTVRARPGLIDKIKVACQQENRVVDSFIAVMLLGINPSQATLT